MREFKVNNWLAMTEQGEYITIDKVTDIHKDYFCPSCNEVLHGRALESELVERHFYHLQNNNLESCNCEQAYKRYWKDNIITVGEIIDVPFLGEITCIDKEINYKINDSLKADIYIRTVNNDNILILFDSNNQVENSKLDYTIFYIDVMELNRDKSNLKDNIRLLHSEQINKLNNKLKSSIEVFTNDFKYNLNKEVLQCKVNIDKFIELQEQLKQVNYYNEYKTIESVINSLKSKSATKYTYKSNIIAIEEINALNKLITTLNNVTNYNIDLDFKILKSINYKIYNKGYYSNNWSKPIYFDLIKPVGQEFNTYIKEVEKIILKINNKNF